MRPGLRCICGVAGEEFQGAVCPEDLVVTPDFFGKATDTQMYDTGQHG